MLGDVRTSVHKRFWSARGCQAPTGLESRNTTAPPGMNRERPREGYDYFATSTSAAAPMPPPMHIVTTP